MKTNAIKFLPLCALLVLTLAAFASAAGAQEPETARLSAATLDGGECGYGMTWRLDTDGVFTVSGKGAMSDYPTKDMVPWVRYRMDIEKLNIEYGVTRIGNNAFNTFPDLIAVTIPETVREIGNYAFADCVSLHDIVIADGLQTIGNSAFTGCSKMTAFPLPKTVTELGQAAFSHCSALSEFRVAGMLRETRASLFADCTSLRTVSLPASVQTVGLRTFSGCMSLSAIEIPGWVSVVAPYAFEKCASLQSVDLPPRLTDIENGVFSGCAALESVGIPDSVRNIKERAFENCGALRMVYYGGTAAQWKGVSKSDFADMIERRFIDVRYGKAEAASDVVIERIDVANGRVTVEIAGHPAEGSTLFLASYDKDGRFLALDTYPIDDPNAYTVYSRDAYTLTAFMLDANRRPAAKAFTKEVT